jgi:uncharacterized protein YdhG (YjbR/CyaY superfamily)
MRAARKAPATIDEYIEPFPPDARAILRRVRETVRKAAPEAEEKISYRMPAYAQNGIVVWFAGFKNHIGLYPPVKGDAGLKKAMARYANEKGNLRFPLDEPIPYRLIERIVKLRIKQNQAKAAKPKSRR